MNDLMTRPDGAADDFERRLRNSLHRLADAAPTTVRAADELDLATVRSLDDHRSSRRRAAGIGGTIALVAGAVGMGAVAFNAAGNGGGAGTPEEAVVTFVDALDHEDVLGVLEIMDPSEVAALRPVLEEATATAQRLDLLDDAFALDGIAGVDLSTDGVELRTETLGPDLAAVTATAGTLTASADWSVFPFGGILDEAVGANDGEADATAGNGGSASVDLSTVHPSATLATVQRDGRWYVSASYTIAELARRNAGVDLPVDAPIAPVGADSPEAATRQLYDRLLAGDLAGAVATAAPGEGDALRAYAELWLPAAQDGLDRELAAGLDLSLDAATFTTRGDEHRATVRSDTFVLTGTVPADWSSTDDMVMTGDPTLPTLISSYDGSGYVLLPAGAAVPATVDGLEWTSWETNPPAEVNYTYANPNGSIDPIAFPDANAQPEPPLPVRVERADGCTTLDPGAAEVMGLTADAIDQGLPGVTAVGGDGSARMCDVDGAFSLGFILVLGGGTPLDLPTVATVEVDGRWYVSPIGTAATAVLEVLTGAEANGSLFDSDLSWWIYGTSRATLRDSLVGLDAADLTDACRRLAITAPATEGTGDVVSDVVEDPSPADTRTCQEDVWTIASVEVSSSDGVTVSGSGTGVGVADTVPASTYPPDSTAVAPVLPVATEAP